jgi:hypothetical protein
VESFDFSQQGVVDAMPRISETARNSGAQSLLFSSDSAGAMPLLAQLLPDNRVGPDQFQYMGLTRWDIPPASLELRGLQGGWFAKPDPALTERSRPAIAPPTAPARIRSPGLPMTASPRSAR